VSDTDLPDPLLVTQAAQLQMLAEKLASQPLIAVDTESNSLYAYQERVCLIQFSIPGEDFLVDPLALDDLSPLAPLFASPQHEKIFHAAEYDLLCLQRDFGFSFANIFDTMVAARTLGEERVGLGSILFAEFGLRLDKRYQRANWGKRPLPRDLLSYARLDTHYLIPLRNRLLERLQQNKLWPLAAEDFNRACRVNGRAPASKDALCWKINGARDLSGQQAAVLQKLCIYRDQMARKLDRPAFKVLSDRILLSLASHCPRRREDLLAAGMTPRQVRVFGKGVLRAIRQGLNAPPAHQPYAPRPSEDYLLLIEALSDWRKDQARRMGVNSDVILPRSIMRKIARQNPSDLQTLGEIMREVPWRFEKFGESILQVVRKGAF